MYAGRTYGTEVRKSINDLEIKLITFINPEDLTTDQQLLVMHVEIYKQKI